MFVIVVSEEQLAAHNARARSPEHDEYLQGTRTEYVHARDFAYMAHTIIESLWACGWIVHVMKDYGRGDELDFSGLKRSTDGNPMTP